MGKIFKSADILIPKNCDMQKWSVVACDQFSSQLEYWEKLDAEIGEVPSTLRLMLPEAYLETRDQFEEAEKINAVMEQYLGDGVFTELKSSYIYVERTLENGALRRGLIGVLDLEEYDYAKVSVSVIRATEGTVEDRLPLRVRVRSGAGLEMPHIIVFIDDEKDRLMGELSSKKYALPRLYDFELSNGGGNVAGYQVSGDEAEAVDEIITSISDLDMIRGKYNHPAPAAFAMGDGNHSLATAKKCWEALKLELSPAERKTHPARFSMVELVNIHDEAIVFEPIHKVLFETDAGEFVSAAREFWDSLDKGGPGHEIRVVTNDADEIIEVGGLMIGELIGKAEMFCQCYLAAHGGRIDYIHNDDTALQMGKRNGGAAILLPTLLKNELFPSIIQSGPFPKKSFSIGHAQDKRYYLECRKIK